MNTEQKKAAVAAYKERKTSAGIYVVRCRTSGETWVGQATNLEAIENRLRFTLTHRGQICVDLQRAWDAHGPEGFSIEALERLEEETLAYVRTKQLKDRAAHWLNALGARPL